MRRVLPVLLAIGVAASGCVYWRLLEFKRQLNNFNENFELRSENGYCLVIRKPVLTGSDFDRLMEVEPTRRIEEPPGTRRVYEYEKDPPDGSPPLVYDFVFTQDELGEIRFPEQFAVLYPEAVMREFFRSFGGAKVNKERRSARGDFDPDLQASFPGKERVLACLGEPSERRVDARSGEEELWYRYRLRTLSAGEKERKRRAFGRFRYDEHGAITALRAGIGKHELSIEVPDASLNPHPAAEVGILKNR